MSSEAFKSIFRPKGIAVWIAPTASEPIPLLARNILAGGYQGRVVLLGSGQEPPAPLERRDGPGQPGPGLELLLFRGDISELANALPALGRAGLKAAVVYSPPPADEIGLKSLLAAARDAGIRLVGPGSWGVVNTAVNLLAVADRPKLKPGQLALITQSKVVCCYMLAEAAKRGIGLGLALDLGAEADLGQDEALDYLAHHYQAKAVGLHLGRVKRPARLVSSALAASREKPVLALKAWEDPEPEGLSAAGRFPAPGPEEAWNAVLRRAGVPLMESLGSLLSSADLAARLGACRGPHVLLLSESVGAAGLALEALTHRGLLPARLDGTSADRLAGLGCQTGVRQGLALLPPEGGQGLLREAATVCLRTYGVDAILAMPAPDPENGAGDLAGALAQAMAACRAGEALPPVLFASPPGSGPPGDDSHPGGLLLFEGPEKALEAYAGLWRCFEATRLAEEFPRRPLGRFTYDTGGAKRLLASARGQAGGMQLPERLELLKAYRLPVAPTKEVATAGELEAACESWGYPSRLILVPKAMPRAGLVDELSWLVRAGSQAAAQWRAARRHAARSGREARVFLAQPRFRGTGPGLMMGWHRHPKLGPLVFFGERSGSGHELREAAWCPAPLNHAQAGAMLARTRAFAEATRADDPERVWPSLLEEMLIKLARMAQDLPEIQNLALGPMPIHDKMPWITDAALETAPKSVPSGGLLVSPYPEHQESAAVSEKGGEVLLRPVRAEDSELVRELFFRLSPESVHSRFFRDIPELSRRMLVSLTQIDYGREIALAAVEAHGLEEKLLGLCSLAARPGSEWAEFSVVVRDSWQRKGIGRLLMTRMAEIARSQGRLKIMGLVQRRNRAMLQLGRELGFSMGPPSEDLVELRWEMEPGPDSSDSGPVTP